MHSKKLTTPQLAAVMAGNGLEFYDFLIFGFFAVQIGAVFFPNQDSTTSLLQTLAIFGVSARICLLIFLFKSLMVGKTGGFSRASGILVRICFAVAKGGVIKPFVSLPNWLASTATTPVGGII